MNSIETRSLERTIRVQNNGSIINVHQHYENSSTANPYIVEIQSSIIESGNYHLLVLGRKLKIIVSETRVINRPLYAHHYNKDVFEKRLYERLRTFSIPLPFHSNLYIEDALFEAKTQTLIVTLKQHLN